MSVKSVNRKRYKPLPSWTPSTPTHTAADMGGYALPKSSGIDSILVIVERLSNYCHFIILKHPVIAKELAVVCIREIVRLHGMPHSTVSNRTGFHQLFLERTAQNSRYKTLHIIFMTPTI